ncbi:hypothetical protein GGD55_006299 [Rhizobium giardinii]|uniref:Uncharacterized protein n=1 Tax=Rhizobium giardinii TaxID=56731 RepID=A0A7W8UHP2_9HYPH|nr:hypothetical protein [Rhizobium giardinii]
MDYDWNGTRTRRLTRLKVSVCFAITSAAAWGIWHLMI